MMRVAIIGAGGHGQVVADALLRMAHAGAAVTLAGFVDDAPGVGPVLGAPVVQRRDDLAHDAAIIAIGDNRRRADVFAEIRAAGVALATVIHPSAVVAPDVSIGDGAVLCAGVVVNTQARIGENAIVNTGATVDHHCVIGAHAHLAPGVHLAGNVTIGEGTLVGIGSVAIPGITVAAWTLVRAGTTIVKGVPA